ncbi:hypothetical protein VTJ04DRAFT_599 [Mycothermus thermophilus]|uniref:uncharacterized protein n=1 Tax=Humicola insolens TaxID=85995 RepID=UPI0037421C3B
MYMSGLEKSSFEEQRLSEKRLTYPVLRYCSDDSDNDTTALGLIHSAQQRILSLSQSEPFVIEVISHGSRHESLGEKLVTYFHQKRSQQKISKILQGLC